ncbi:hypothetical protein SARC_01848 [Sphaeroforma arctica JP610]|uniref:Sodium/hydrogen exchanger n=1 Tax=Sphaeroforma arctica JP610 TaxID=667725 RepID=A0A0L0GCN0_9EUKA|nr:hypothetical protein SARC_01848 [Sphaeroforma arctica JP610]KNC86003.1 hypothetical protein SARC_01848 [Sphaeroforma arctica JP610]|eukprot:XP_014159905.1 hypothetical protein SARC_01848 [Sphaeroforma arctica JP610]
MEDSDIAPGESAEEILADGQDLEENSGVSSGLEGAQGEKLGLERAQTEQPGLEEAQDSSVADESLPETGEEVVQSEESVTDGDAQMQETRPDIVTVNTGTSQTEPQGDTEQAVGGEEIVLGDVESEDGDEITGDEIMGDEKLTSAETVLGDGPGRVDTGYMGMLSANGPYTQDEVAGDEELVDDEKLTGDANLMDGDIFTEDEKLMGDEEIVSDEKLIGGDILVGDDELVGGVLSLENGDSADTLAQAERMPSPVGSTPETGLKNEDKEAERDENGPETDGGAPQNQAGGPEVAGSTAALAGAAPGSGTAGVAEDKADGPVDSDADADDEDDEEKEAEEMPHGLEEGDTEETDHSRKMFFIFVVLALCVGVVHALITLDFHWLPESIAVILVGHLCKPERTHNQHVYFMNGYLSYIACSSASAPRHSVTTGRKRRLLHLRHFFLVLLPPIIFESGYSLHKGNFFRNIGTILTFAVAGTLLSAFLIGVSLYVLGSVGLSYSMSFIHCLVFGSLISAIDPVATLAIFKALKVDQILEALVFGESVLNDAVAIVATRTLLTIADEGEVNMGTFFRAISIFFVMGFGSAFLGIISGLISALVTKHVALHKSPSLEFSIVCVFAYLPYWLAEALDLSGIMAILFCGIVMAHYTHPNLSPITQITSQNTFRTMAFLAETAVFAYLGLAVFSFAHSFDWGLIFWSLVLCFVSRALNIFPLASLVNKHRKVKIPFKFQVIMWFSGLRGAIAFTLSLDLPEVHFAEQYRVLVTTTLVIVIFTIVVCGGCTLPLLKALGLQVDTRDIDMSKTEQMVCV